MRAHLLPGGRWIWLLDVAAVVWIAAWAFLAIRVSDEVGGLRELSITAESAGRAVREVGRTLDAINLPFVGERIDNAARSVTEAGERTVGSARATRDSVRELRLLLGLSVGLIPVSPLLLVYLPLRIARMRERRALRALLVRSREDPELRELLARRALETMSYRRLADLPGRPWADGEGERGGGLVALEAERVGARRP